VKSSKGYRMSHVIRSTLQLVASATAAAAVARVVESKQRTLPEPAPDVHPQEPTKPLAAVGGPVTHGIGFHPARDVSGITAKNHPNGARPSRTPATETLVREIREPQTTVAMPNPPMARSFVTEASSAKGETPAQSGSVSGTITDVYGRGLRDVTVEVVTEDKTVAGATTTGADGRYEVEDVPPGTYKMRAFDGVDHHFEKSWFGGPTFSSAEAFTVKSGKTRRTIMAVLRSMAKIEVEAADSQGEVDAVVTVTHRATGAPASGVVEMSTKGADVTAVLVDGKGRHSFNRTGKKLRVKYAGDHQTRPESTTVRLP
jgi:hypothetical protein